MHPHLRVWVRVLARACVHACSCPDINGSVAVPEWRLLAIALRRALLVNVTDVGRRPCHRQETMPRATSYRGQAIGHPVGNAIRNIAYRYIFLRAAY